MIASRSSRRCIWNPAITRHGSYEPDAIRTCHGAGPARALQRSRLTLVPDSTRDPSRDGMQVCTGRPLELAHALTGLFIGVDPCPTSP